MRPDLPHRQIGPIGSGFESGSLYTEGDCSIACDDYHFFSLQQDGQCSCGNSSVRSYGPGSYKNAMNLGCDCDGPDYGWNVECVWQQIPPLIKGLDSGRTEIWATQLGLMLLPEEEELRMVNENLGAGLNNMQCEVTKIENPERSLVEVALGDVFSSSGNTIGGRCQNTNGCLLWFGLEKVLLPNRWYTFSCRGVGREAFRPRHVKEFRLRSNHIGLVLEPKFGITDSSAAFMEVGVRNMDVRPIRYRCHAREAANPGTFNFLTLSF